MFAQFLCCLDFFFFTFFPKIWTSKEEHLDIYVKTLAFRTYFRKKIYFPSAESLILNKGTKGQMKFAFLHNINVTSDVLFIKHLLNLQKYE